jgi:hypothetical protein
MLRRGQGMTFRFPSNDGKIEIGGWAGLENHTSEECTGDVAVQPLTRVCFLHRILEASCDEGRKGGVEENRCRKLFLASCTGIRSERRIQAVTEA